MARIIGLSTHRGALPITRKRPTIDVRIFNGTSAFSVFLKDDTFFDGRDVELSADDLEKVKAMFLEYVSEGESEYALVKEALKL